ncbi:uncharacterized protein BO95DRAFT_262604 [Aspergillus brunneoviolaceus CBS 621.78]|uniref:Uncharacterized protein n=1 Tax=Aspergillus brunneoviolaceus CBS 621.78 TaxID=1450534 RepID=A0ACD1FX30_9EURO|nr:hypothetical protein BO95DRAFT_262604 [Aspergillus brunneoviolaceus CBS 621.78]RAH41530.1 hypothetical protein BO95DRAFT_262604 [Aspergillus brunneoviolaceus CBS 621.78]
MEISALSGGSNLLKRRHSQQSNPRSVVPSRIFVAAKPDRVQSVSTLGPSPSRSQPVSQLQNSTRVSETSRMKADGLTATPRCMSFLQT